MKDRGLTVALISIVVYSVFILFAIYAAGYGYGKEYMCIKMQTTEITTISELKQIEQDCK